MSPIKTILFLVALGSTISALGIDSEDLERFRKIMNYVLKYINL